MKAKKIMYVNRRPPQGSIAAQESLDVVLIGAAFEQDVCVTFIDDGVLQLIKAQKAETTGAKNVAKSLAALGDYDVRYVYVEEESLQERGLDTQDLIEIWHENPEDDYRNTESIRLISRAKLSRLMTRQDLLIHF